MIPRNIEKKHIIMAIQEINSNGIPSRRRAKKFLLIYDGKNYPPKYVLTLANWFANGNELQFSDFGGGLETNNFLERLGFKIIEKSSRKKKIKSKSSKKKKVYNLKDLHTERCPKCKDTIKEMLIKIYGNVEKDYNLKVKLKLEDYKNYKFYKNLKKILLELENYRGYKDFIKRTNQINCDYYIQNPNFIVEFDETQHFTYPRKISLQNYPENLKVGFSIIKWIEYCEKFNRHDNDPAYRDEQRAWYETIRDFLPLIKNYKPTVRLYSNEMQWCKLDPENTMDVEYFKKLIEIKQNIGNGWIATVVIQSNGTYSEQDRLNAITQILDLVSIKTNGNGVILFPGGWISAGDKEAKSMYNPLKEKVQKILEKYNRNIIISFGIDGRVSEDYSEDQIGIAISKKGIEAIGRKFHAAPQEKGKVQLARNYLSKEENEYRHFELDGIKYFICACYDSFGIRQKNLSNKLRIDIILDLVHGFWPRTQGPSGASYFARHGFAGASKQWNCLVFGATIFFNPRKIPENWPTGVYWIQVNKKIKNWRYRDNPVRIKEEFKIEIKEGYALIRIFNQNIRKAP